MGCICGPITGLSTSSSNLEDVVSGSEIDQIRQLGVSSVEIKFHGGTDGGVSPKIAEGALTGHPETK
jgi:hypothetical protein